MSARRIGAESSSRVVTDREEASDPDRTAQMEVVMRGMQKTQETWIEACAVRRGLFLTTPSCYGSNLMMPEAARWRPSQILLSGLCGRQGTSLKSLHARQGLPSRLRRPFGGITDRWPRVMHATDIVRSESGGRRFSWLEPVTNIAGSEPDECSIKSASSRSAPNAIPGPAGSRSRVRARLCIHASDHHGEWSGEMSGLLDGDS
jgi:hypothetical protein